MDEVRFGHKELAMLQKHDRDLYGIWDEKGDRVPGLMDYAQSARRTADRLSRAFWVIVVPLVIAITAGVTVSAYASIVHLSGH
jgi:hypothetical protein